jgi:predicted GNAT superfamily acetyltransferase
VELVAIGEDDLDDVLELNQRCTPHVGALDRVRLDRIVGQCRLALRSRTGSGALAGFVLVLGEGADYDSPNYRWFDQRHDSFRYVDRIAVHGAERRSGLGRALYRAVFDHARTAGVARVCAEVNVEPPNPTSMRFHESFGFAEVGRQDTYGGTVRVALLEAPVA